MGTDLLIVAVVRSFHRCNHTRSPVSFIYSTYRSSVQMPETLKQHTKTVSHSCLSAAIWNYTRKETELSIPELLHEPRNLLARAVLIGTRYFCDTPFKFISFLKISLSCRPRFQYTQYIRHKEFFQFYLRQFSKMFIAFSNDHTLLHPRPHRSRSTTELTSILLIFTGCVLTAVEHNF
jgi:hypothetical protein